MLLNRIFVHDTLKVNNRINESQDKQPSRLSGERPGNYTYMFTSSPRPVSGGASGDEGHAA